MQTADVIRRSGIGIGPERTLRDAAIVMERAGVGSLAIIDGDLLVGIVTDRDLVRRGMARGLDPDARIDSVMSAPVVTVDADADVHETFALFRTHPVRRLAVVRDAHFVGMIAVDDLLVELASDLSDLVHPVAAEVRAAQHDSPLPAAVTG